MKNSQLLQTCNWTSQPADEKSDSETELGSRVSLVKTKRKKAREKSRGDDPETPVLINEKPLNSAHVKPLKRHENVKSTEEPNDRTIPTAMDVVVDVHHYKESDIASDKIQSKPAAKIKKTQDNLTPEELDLIEEFEENDEDNETFQVINETSEKPRRRKQWDVPGHSVEIKKPPRKRWTKDASLIRLPETKSSSTTSSGRESPTNPTKKPVPAPRTAKREAQNAFDNAAFVVSDDEVLRIETDHKRESTKIEMRNANDRQETDVSSIDSDDRVSDEKNVETVIAIEPTEEPRKSNEKIVKVHGNAVIDHSEESDIGYSSTDRIFSQSSNRRRSFDSDRSVSEKEVADTNVSRSTEDVSEESIGSEEKLRKVKKSSRKDPSQETLSTNEETEETRTSVKSTGSTRKLVSSSVKKRRQSRDQVNGECNRKEETSSSFQNSEEKETKETKKKKKKKKKREKKKEELKYVSVTIHRADMLETDYITKHPMVKVHIVETETGNYLRNTENRENGGVYLQPMITGKFDFKENRSMIPVWEEELIFEHDFSAITNTENGQVVILFEVVDLLSFAEASFNYDKLGSEGCWYKIAWGFLKPVGVNNTMHTDKKVRLQLYRPRRNLKKFGRHKCEVYTWWKSNSREKYPSSLFVTVTSVDPPKLEPVFYQQLSLHDLSDMRNESHRISTRTSDSISLPKWTRLAAQSCKIPNDKLFETEISENGCFFVAFSNDGKFLAYVSSEEYDYPLVVYEIEAKKIYVRFAGHKTFVYSLNWSIHDTHLLSVSSDQTARVWDVQNKIVQHIEILPHPSYVYCGKFTPGNASTIVTGCYDKIARIWAKDKKSKNRELHQELEGHDGFVNSMCFQKDGTLLTADSVGVIIVWTVKKNRRTPLGREWQISRRIKVRELKGVTINTIVLHPLESRLLVHSRNNGLRMLDIASGVVLQKYNELNNQRIQSTACISPCGSLIFCGGEDSSLNVWCLETGKYIAKYTIERTFRAVTSVDYHPYDHVLAFSTFGSPAPVRVLKFDKEATGESVGLKLIDDEIKAHSELAISTLDLSLSTRDRSRSSSRKQNIEELARETRKLLSPQSSLLENGRYEETKIKLRRLNETEQTLRSKSTNRLFNIIEKIDRILSHTSRSSDDLESGRNLERSRVSSEQNGDEGKSRRSKSSSLIFEDHGSSYMESTVSSERKEAFELKTLWHGIENEIDDRRSKSAKETRTTRIDEEIWNPLSDSAANSKKQVFQKENVRSGRKSTFLVRPIAKSSEIDSSDSAILRKEKKVFDDRASSSDSGGTYVLEKADLEKNKDAISAKASENGSFLRVKSGSNSAKTDDSGNSILSNATFTVENEKPVPKPRKKK